MPKKGTKSGTKHRNAMKAPYRKKASYKKPDRCCRPELKTYDTNFFGATAFAVSSATPIIQSLNQLAQGVASNQRVGRKVQCEYIQGKLLSVQSTTVSPLRVAVIWDKESNGVTPTIAEIYNAGNPFLGLINPGNRERFVTLHDEIWDTPVTAGANLGPFTGASSASHTIFKKLSKMGQTTQNLDTTTATGALWLVIQALGAPVETVQGYFRMRYSDV